MAQDELSKSAHRFEVPFWSGLAGSMPVRTYRAERPDGTR
jgi:hypothetical protein